jgi:hypothetical protein
MKTKNYSELNRMDIWATPGTKVIFDAPNAGYPHDQEKLKKYGLVVGRVYTVDYTVIHSSSTDVYLVGFPDVYFNSVNFGEIAIPAE